MSTIARIASAAAIVLAAAPMIAAGSAHAETLTRRIAVADIDFTRADQVARFDERVARVAYAICPLETRQNRAKAEACRTDLRNQAVANLGAPQRQQLARLESGNLNLAAK